MSHSTLEAPYPSEWTVRRALDAYLEENGFTESEYEAKMTPASFLGIRFSVPNTKKHQAGIRRHDLHHIATGFGTDLVGEGEISAWELRTGVVSVGVYVGAIIFGGALMGGLIAPRRAVFAWRAAASTRNLFADADYDALLRMSVGELRARLGVPASGIATAPRQLHAYAPSLGS